ncbi:MAG: hypothetical protein QW478_13370 [Candidatus Micrarchaeaceae archaeon]
MARLYTYKITLSNTTSTATPPNLQVRLNINFASLVSNINADLGNIRFSSDQAGNNLLYAWLESAPQGTFTQGSSVSSYTSSNVWVNLGNNIIPANGLLNIYMQVLSNGTEFDGVYWGANPLWTSTYGQYDNGANVFIYYQNWAGTTAPANWAATSHLTATVDNGVTITTSAIEQLYYYTIPLSPPYIVDTYTTAKVLVNTTNYFQAFPLVSTTAGSYTDYYGVGWQYQQTYWKYTINGGAETLSSVPLPAIDSPYIVSLQMTSSSSNLIVNGQTVGSSSSSGIGTSYFNFYTDGGTNTINWWRVRTYPPNGTDPVLTSVQILFLGNYTSSSIPSPEWATLSGKPYITVSGKGISNGLSNIPNDGADFGPDTLLGASSSNQYGPPYTQTSGLQEAWNYAVSVGVLVEGLTGVYEIPVIRIVSNITISAPVTFSGNGKMIYNPKLEGNSSMSPVIFCALNDAYAITYDPNSFNNVNIRVSNITAAGVSGYSPMGIIKADFTGTSYNNNNTFESYNLDVSSAYTQAPVYLGGFFTIMMYNYEAYNGGVAGTYPGGYFNAWTSIQMIGGYSAVPITFTNNSGVTAIDLIGFVAFEVYIGAGYPVASVNIIGNFTNAMAIYLNSNVGSITLIGGGFDGDNGVVANGTPLLNVGVSGDTWTVGLLTIKGFYIQNVSTYTIVGPSITVLNSDITLYESGVTVTYPLIVPTTPSVPASGTAQQNTNPYPVNVYIYGGTVTAIDYTPDGGTAVQVGTSGPATVRLNPNDSITLTYSAAPTWVWTKA